MYNYDTQEFNVGNHVGASPLAGALKSYNFGLPA